ncbi:hypothetical protein V1511DRAFT_502755 [Dipodascopsis uninucleata]
MPFRLLKAKAKPGSPFVVIKAERVTNVEGSSSPEKNNEARESNNLQGGGQSLISVPTIILTGESDDESSQEKSGIYSSADTTYMSEIPTNFQIPEDNIYEKFSAEVNEDKQSSREINSRQSIKKRHRISAAIKGHLHGRRERSTSTTSSVHVPQEILNSPFASPNNLVNNREDDEELWESRAVKLAMKEHQLSESLSLANINDFSASSESSDDSRVSRSDGVSHASSIARPPYVGVPKTEETLQKAIDLHEAGKIEESTKLFAELADPNGENNPLAQLLYGLSLRHGWGVEANPEKAVAYLRLAASNSALIEESAKKSGVMIGKNRKAGAGGAKGELVLAIFELANCFRFGWGVQRDPIAAKCYYETAARLGDPDAMSETGWCLLEGFGCEKNKFAAAQFYRMAEKAGKVEVGQSWIWKEKYDPKTKENA